MKKSLYVFFGAIILALPTYNFAGTSKQADTATTSPHSNKLMNMNLVDIITHVKTFSILQHAIQAADLEDLLDSQSPYTLFAPTNAAFAKFPAETLTSLLNDKEKLIAFVKYHLVPGRVTVQDIQDGAIRTLQGNMLDIEKNGDIVQINNANIIGAEIITTNGVIHEIDTVLMPPAMVNKRQAKLCKIGSAVE